jgi:hypothetical protein
VGDIVLHTTTGDVVVPVGRRVSVGSDADVRLVGLDGREDRYLHGVACLVAASDTAWTVQVPQDRWVRVSVADRFGPGTADVPPDGREHHFTFEAAELVLRSDAHAHRVLVNASRQTVGPAPSRRGRTLRPVIALDPHDTEDRALIAACRDRLAGVGGPPLTHREVAVLLARSPFAADAELREETARQRAHRALQRVAGHLEMSDVSLPAGSQRRAVVVDYLVQVGAVTESSFRVATGQELR